MESHSVTHIITIMMCEIATTKNREMRYPFLRLGLLGAKNDLQPSNIPVPNRPQGNNTIKTQLPQFI